MDYSLKAKQILSNCLSIPVSQIDDSALIERLKPAFDSVDFAALVMHVERFLGREVAVKAWLNLSSVSDLAAILQQNHVQ